MPPAGGHLAREGALLARGFLRALFVATALWLSACVPPDVLQPVPAPITAVVPPTPPPDATPAPVSGGAAALTPGLSPGVSPAQATATLAATARSWNDWDTYLTALLPEARPTADLLAGMTQYHLNVLLASDLTALTGEADIRYTNRETEPLDIVYLHLFPNLWDGGMTVSRALVAGQPVSPTYPSGDDVIGLPLAQPLRPGETVDLSLRFTTPVPQGGAGNYGELASQGGVLALAHFYPTVVVYDRGWHLETPSSQGDVIYHDASLYDVTFTAPDSLTVVATGATLDKTRGEPGTATWRLVGGPMRDFNIVASGHYEKSSVQVGDVAVNSYYLPADTGGGRQALEWAATALRTYQAAFGPYPYAELDVVGISTSAGGIEYPGMVAISLGLFGDWNSRAFFEAATVHEVAHQWWYNVVGNDQVNHPWLDESLAQYSTYLYYLSTYGEQGAKGFEDSLRARWERVNFAEKPIGLPVREYEGREYGAIVYGRGALFFLTLRDEIGEEKMAELLRRYYSEYAWQIASPEAFRTLAESVAGKDLGPLFEKWVYPR